MTAKELMDELNGLADPARAQNSAWFFKTGEGEYGAGDKFIGVKVPQIRSVCKKYKTLNLAQIETLLESPVHEHRLAALLIMTEQSKRANESQKKDLFELYMRRHDRINNWDLVDTACGYVVGRYLMDKPRNQLYKLAKSKDIWERRTAIVSTLAFIADGELKDTFALSELLLDDNHDLIHKAVGWMLREAGKRDMAALKQFLNKHSQQMPRTMLRYSIEKFSPSERARYMSKKVSSVK